MFFNNYIGLKPVSNLDLPYQTLCPYNILPWEKSKIELKRQMQGSSMFDITLFCTLLRFVLVFKAAVGLYINFVKSSI